jgi:hypothetical protein
MTETALNVGTLSFREYIDFHRINVYDDPVLASAMLVAATIVNFYGTTTRLFSLAAIVMSLIMYLSQVLEARIDLFILELNKETRKTLISLLEDIRDIVAFANLNMFILVFVSIVFGFILMYCVRILFYLKVLTIVIYAWEALEPYFELERSLEDILVFYTTMGIIGILALFAVKKAYRLTYCLMFSAFGTLHILIAVESLFGTYMKIGESIGCAFKNGVENLMENWTFLVYLLLLQLGVFVQMYLSVLGKSRE